MNILYHTATQTLRPWPRSDDEPVIGLSAEYEVFTLTQEQPPEFDASKQSLAGTQVIDTNAKTVTRGWEIVDVSMTVTLRSLQLRMTQQQRQQLAAGIASMPEGKQKAEALIYFQRTTTVSRSHPMLAVFATFLSLDSAGIDALFAAAQAQDQIEASYLT